MNQKIAAVYNRILKSELVAAMGCTEPIAIAYAAAKAREVLGWEATKTLEDMCRDAWHWQKNNPRGYNS